MGKSPRTRFSVKYKLPECHLNGRKWGPSLMRDMTQWNNGQDWRNHQNFINGGGHCQTKYPLIMTTPLKQEYKLGGEEGGWMERKRERLEQNIMDRYTRESENIIWRLLKSCSIIGEPSRLGLNSKQTNNK